MRPAFGTVLRSYRTNRGLTQEELADRSGLSVRAIRNLEIGRTERPQRQSVVLLATALRLAEPDRAALLAAAGRRDTTRPARCELPPDVPDLAGRDHAVAAITRVLTTPGARLGLVDGGPGVGRTALAVHVAHRVRDRFPDGQVFADLTHPDGILPPEAVLGRVLRSLGTTDLPASRDERAAMLRARLAARRMLVVLDNVASEAQVRPLLTTASPSAILVTSRCGLVALPGARHVRLGPLDTRAAWQLLARLAGRRVLTEPDAANAVIDACARLPLALQIAGTWLATRPHRAVTELAALLADRALDRLTVADLSMRASISAHAAELRPAERQLLHQLAHSPEHVNPAEPEFRDDLDGLAQANLLTPHGSGYRMNPLVRQYARELAATPLLRAAQ
ncbi:helix-turn-helix domain-containing protein [Actinophytocola sp.]|uniref:helix-turn-helix domain-containing protein n=1 Tax=Actinophytocola sp. TaxID=1872138 RepID=UPI002ED45583